MASFRDLQKRCSEYKKQGHHSECCGGHLVTRETLLVLMERVESLITPHNHSATNDENHMSPIFHPSNDIDIVRLVPSPLKSRSIVNNPLSHYGTSNKKLGTGSFGSVYMYEGGSYGKSVAVKVMDLMYTSSIDMSTSHTDNNNNNNNNISEQSTGTTIIRPTYQKRHGTIQPQTIIEIAVLNATNHPNLMSLIDVIELPNDSIGIVMDAANMGSLNNAKHHLTDLQIKQTLYDATCGIAYLHSLSIIHRDIKPHNVLVFSGINSLTGAPTITAKVSDFGSAVTQSCLHRLENDFLVGTLRFRAPEIFLEQAYTYGADVWSLGVMIYEVCKFARFLADAESISHDIYEDLDYVTEIVRRLGRPSEDVTIFNQLPDYYAGLSSYVREWHHTKIDYDVPVKNPLLEELLQGILQYEPSYRMRAYAVCMHPFFSKVRDTNREFELNNCNDILYSSKQYPTAPYNMIASKELNNFVDLCIDNLVNIMIETNSSIVTLETAMRILDEFLLKDNMQNDLFELIAIAIWGIAESIIQLTISSMERLIDLSKNKFTDDDILRVQREILKTINYDIFFVIEDDYRLTSLEDGINSNVIDEIIGVALTTSEARFHLTALQISHLASRCHKAYFGLENIIQDDLRFLKMTTTGITTGLDFFAREIGFLSYDDLLTQILTNVS